MKEGKNPGLETQMKWMNPVTFQMNRGEEGKKETVFSYKYSVSDSVWEKNQTHPWLF